MDARHMCMHDMGRATPASEWGDLAALARGMQVRKVPLKHVQANFHCGVCAAFKFCHKIASVA